MAKIVLTGNLTADAVVNAVSDKQDAVNFTIASNESRKNAAGEWENHTEFNNCTRFMPSGKGVNLAEKLTKGRFMEVVGNIRTGEPREAKNGKTYQNHSVDVEELQFGPKKGE